MGNICSSKDLYKTTMGTIYNIPECTPNKFNRVYPYAMFGVFWTSWFATAIPLFILGSYFRALQNVWILFLPIIFYDFKNFIPSEIKLSEGNALLKMGTCSIMPYIKLMNVRFRFATNEDFAKCNWPHWQCSPHDRGMLWSKDRTDVPETTEIFECESICVEGEYRHFCFTFHNQMIIVPSFAPIDKFQV